MTYVCKAGTDAFCLYSTSKLTDFVCKLRYVYAYFTGCP